MSALFDLIATVLAFFYDQVWDSYGMAVVFLTLTVMVIATPLTLKSTKSMLQMQRLQPELKAIQNRYKDDRQKMNEELMAFYQENGINPLGGCLPLLVQLPIFLVLFRVVQGITRRTTQVGNQFGWTSGQVRGDAEMIGSSAFGSTDRTFDPENLPHDSDMFLDLSGETEMVSWGMDLSRTAQDVLGDNLVDALPYLILIVIVLVSSLYQQRQIQGRNTGAEINPQQQMIMRVLPWMLPVFSFTMPAALVVYFVVSNLYRIGQQAYITRSLYSGEDSPGQQLARQRAEEKAKGRSGADRATGGRTTPKKGTPTPKRDTKSSRGASAGSRGGGKSGGRAGGKSGSKAGGRNGGKAGAGRDGGGAPSAGTKKGSPAPKKGSGTDKSASSGAGRTGKAPSRHHRGGGRTTEPGNPQNRKRKKS